MAVSRRRRAAGAARQDLEIELTALLEALELRLLGPPAGGRSGLVALLKTVATELLHQRVSRAGAVDAARTEAFPAAAAHVSTPLGVHSGHRRRAVLLARFLVGRLHRAGLRARRRYVAKAGRGAAAAARRYPRYRRCRNRLPYGLSPGP